MKKLLFIICGLVYTNCYAQVDYNKVVLPYDIQEDIPMEERLVQLAWKNHPDNEILRKQTDIATYDITRAKLSWLNNIRAQGNINEFTLNPDAAGEGRTIPFYPKYNFSLTLPLGIFVETPLDIKVAKQRYKMAQEQENSQMLSLRAEVLTRYQNYLMSEQIFQIQSEVSEDAFAKYGLSKQQFENGEITIEDYNLALQGYNAQRIVKIRAERDLLVSKVSLEELIGIKLEDVR